MNRTLKAAFAVTALVAAAHAAAQVTFYEGEGYRGRAFTTARQVDNFARIGFNDRASSVVVSNGRWEVCENERFQGHCVLLRPGNYESLRALGMENMISSVRPARGNGHYTNEAPAPSPVASYEYRRRPNERVYDAPVTAVHAVMGPTTQHCWVERQQVSEPRNSNVGGAVAGALLGGILGHQVGGGSGKDLATVGGAVAGGVIGSNMGGGSTSGPTDLRRCENTVSGTPAYWEVTYNFRGRDHQLQMSAAPGATIAVNSYGEPRQ